MSSPDLNSLPDEFSSEHVLILTPHVGSPSQHLKVYLFDGLQDSHLEARRSHDIRLSDSITSVFDIRKMLERKENRRLKPIGEADASVIFLAEKLNDILKKEYYDGIIKTCPYEAHRFLAGSLDSLYRARVPTRLLHYFLINNAVSYARRPLL